MEKSKSKLHHSAPRSACVAKCIDNTIEMIKIEWKEYVDADGTEWKLEMDGYC